MKIICIGRNYKAHAEELKNELPKEPLVFIKPDTALLRENKPFYYPEYSKDIHYECELFVRIGKPGKYIDESFAMDYIDSVGLGIDFTARDLQQEAKANGLPWEKAKAFNDSAPVSDFIPVSELKDLQDLRFQLSLNDKVVQDGWTGDMIFTIPELISYTSKFFTLKTGDLIFTGTPQGVGPVSVGDTLVGTLEGREMFRFEVK